MLKNLKIQGKDCQSKGSDPPKRKTLDEALGKLASELAKLQIKEVKFLIELKIYFIKMWNSSLFP